MNALILHFTNGNIFFFGTTIILITPLMSMLARGKVWAFISRILVVTGILFVTLSSTPLPIWLYFLWGIPVLFFLSDKDYRIKVGTRHIHTTPSLILLFSFTAIALELPHHLRPHIDIEHPGKLYVIGDSISAGVGNNIITWPTLLQRQFNVEVANYSEAGLKLEGAIRWAEKLERVYPDDCLILLEIGGNDILGKTDVHTFEHNLQELLKLVSGPSRTVILLELPLPPFYNRYGKAQRTLAAKHDAILIPKRYFAGVAGRPGSTIDGLHLSQVGHQIMAEMIWSIISDSDGDMSLPDNSTNHVER